MTLKLQNVPTALCVVAIVLLLFVSFALVLAPGQTVGAANACQHLDHSHYHSPYLHDDYYDFTGISHNGTFHRHNYTNTTHSSSFTKDCDTGDV